MSKSSIRAAVLQRRNSLSAQECRALSIRIQDHLLALPEFARAKVLALYSPFGSEVQTTELFAAARKQGKTVVYPRMTAAGLDFVVVESLHSMEVCRFGILEPTAGVSVAPGNIDLLVVPGVGFTVSGARLGYGQGWYDRALIARGPQTLLVGVCFELQLLETLPVEPHDVSMDLLVTEQRLVHITTGVA